MRKGLKFSLPLLLFLVFFGGCENKGIKEQEDKESHAEKDRKNAEVTEMLYRKDAVLLSLKYEVDDEKIFRMLIEMNPIPGVTGSTSPEEFMKLVRGTNTKEKINSYSQKFDIPSGILASIIIDYENMQKCEQ